MGGATAVNGVVKRAYPLRPLGASGSRPEDAVGLTDPFSPGAGPCGHAATQVVTAVVENHILFRASLSMSLVLVPFHGRGSVP
jgi:hypothetical protein